MLFLESDIVRLIELLAKGPCADSIGGIAYCKQLIHARIRARGQEMKDDRRSPFPERGDAAGPEGRRAAYGRRRRRIVLMSLATAATSRPIAFSTNANSIIVIESSSFCPPHMA